MHSAKPFLMTSLFLCALGGVAHADGGNGYRATILVSNQEGEAPVVDPLLVNAWGIVSSTISPWWVADNETGALTAYDGTGAKLSLDETLPDPTGTNLPLDATVPGAPTGIVFYGGRQFEVAPDAPARLIFASEDGTLSAWNPFLDATRATVVFSDPGSVYKGLAIVGNRPFAADRLFTTDFTECEVEAFDGTFTQIETEGGFEDDSIPEGFCPFGIQAIGHSIFVTYARAEGDEDVPGQGNGFVREFDEHGNLIAEVASRGELNSPWGLALAPADFGQFSGCLIVGNFGDGRLNAYCEDAGGFQHAGTLRENQQDIVIDGLWGIGFGNGTLSGPTNVLFFAAGPDDEENGSFGKIEVAGSP